MFTKEELEKLKKLTDAIKVKDGSELFEYAANELNKLCESYVKWFKMKNNPNRDSDLKFIADNLEKWAKQLQTRD